MWMVRFFPSKPLLLCYRERDQPTYSTSHPLFVSPLHVLFQSIQQLANKLPRITMHKQPTSPAPIVGLPLMPCLMPSCKGLLAANPSAGSNVSRGFTYATCQEMLGFFTFPHESKSETMPRMVHMTKIRRQALSSFVLTDLCNTRHHHNFGWKDDSSSTR